MSKSKIESGIRHIILVEGTHDKDFVDQLLLEHHLASAQVQVLPLGGKTILGSSLRILVNDPAFSEVQSLVILRDADSIVPDANATAEQLEQQATRTAAVRSLASVKSSLLNARLNVPSAHAEITQSSPRIGIYIFPDGQADGMLESLCRDALQGHADTPCIDAFFDCVLKLRSTAKFSPKAWTHAFIAVQDDPDLHLGKAAKKGYLPLTNPVFERLIQFIRTALHSDQNNE